MGWILASVHRTKLDRQTKSEGCSWACLQNSKPRHATAGPPSMFNLLSFSVSGNYADISAAQIRTSSSTASFLSIASHVLRISNFDVQSTIPYHII